jgi:hypothetical protein
MGTFNAGAFTLGLPGVNAKREDEKVVLAHPYTELPVCPFTIAKKAGIIVQPKNSPGTGGK